MFNDAAFIQMVEAAYLAGGSFALGEAITWHGRYASNSSPLLGRGY